MASQNYNNVMSRAILIFIGCGLLLMLYASFSERITNPSLVVGQRAGNDGTKAKNSSSGMNAEIPGLMQQLSENPNDVGIIVHLTEHLVGDGEFESAVNFINRAIAIEPNNSKANYWLGVAQHSLGKHEEAVVALEKSLAGDDDPTVRRSLGLIYIYYLNDTAKGVAHLNEALNNPKATGAVKKLIREELEKVPTAAK